jgi:hypothetical protein
VVDCERSELDHLAPLLSIERPVGRPLGASPRRIVLTTVTRTL